MRTRRPVAAITLMVLAACGGSTSVSQTSSVPYDPSISFSSSSITDGIFPARLTCDGNGTSPALTWSGLPAGTRSVAISVKDTDAFAFVHWAAAGLTPDATIDEGTVPAGVVEGKNGFGRSGYGGPCPPKGKPAHTYLFNLYALRADPGLRAGFTEEAFRAAMERDAIAMTAFSATYRRAP